MPAIEGGCLCGACRYETDAAPINVRACHCRLCQKATGAPLYARVMVPLDQVTMTGPIGWYHSSDALRRGFCTLCGTTLFSERASANLIGLTMGSLDDPAPFAPESHIWVSSKQPWMELDDGVPHYPEGLPPQ
jgi:hypothetical protein